MTDTGTLIGRGKDKDGGRATEGLQGHKTGVRISLGDHLYLHSSSNNMIYHW